MSYFDWLDVVSLSNIFSKMYGYEIEALVKAFPSIEGFVKKLAHHLMKIHCPTLYSDTDAYLRWKSRKATHMFTFTHDDTFDPATIKLTSVANDMYRDHHIKNITVALCEGLAPPPGTDICIVLICSNIITPITVWLNIEDAINYYLGNRWASSADDIFEKYNESLPDQDKHMQYISMRDEGMNKWLSEEHPTIPRPFTKKNVADHIRKHGSVHDIHLDSEVCFIHLRTDESMYN